MSDPSCFKCGCSPNDIIEYREGAKAASLHQTMLGLPPVSPIQFMMATDPTYDKEKNKFCCTWCYAVAKMVAEQGGPPNGRTL